MKNNVVILTGASKGIGEGLAIALAEAGAQLALAARDIEALDRVAALCRAKGAKVITMSVDVANESECKQLVHRTVEAFGRVDTLINNAGASMWARFDEIKEARILEQLMRVNYFGAMYCTMYALPHIKASRGRIVSIASLAGKTGVPTRTGYAASKHAMMGFFDSLRIELMDTGVTVTSICPGFVSTGIRENAAGPDGRAIAISPVKEGQVMSVAECVRICMHAIEYRKREVVMTARGKLGMWLKLIAPSVVDGIARKAIATGR
jgi:short-subunit dehydrogenase